jgi:hypothetical protein
MDDTQLETELAALTSTPAAESEQSEATPEKPEGEAADAKTETEPKPDDGKTEDAGDDAGSEDKPEDGKVEDEDKPKKKLSGSERLKRRLAAVEAENAALRSRSGDGEVNAGELERRIGKPPKEDDFKGDYLAYERALTAYELDKRQVTREMRGEIDRANQARVDRRREASEDHLERVEEFKTKVKDYDETLKSAAGIKVSPLIEELILDSDKSAHLVYHLAKNPDRIARLNDMSEREAAREIGRIESRLSLPNPKTATQAPPPVKSVKGGASPSSPEKDLDAWLSKTYGKK